MSETCSKCNKAFASKFTLKDHEKSCLNEVSSTVDLSCDTCKKTFESLKKLKRHIKIHTKTFICNQSCPSATDVQDGKVKILDQKSWNRS